METDSEIRHEEHKQTATTSTTQSVNDVVYDMRTTIAKRWGKSVSNVTE
jgi:hypothetical protein